jgi:hypothetical protein
MGRHFENCRRTCPTSTIYVFVLPKWAKFNELTQHWNLYQEFPARTYMFTRKALEDPTQQEVAAPSPWQLWSVQLFNCGLSTLIVILRTSSEYSF